MGLRITEFRKFKQAIINTYWNLKGNYNLIGYVLENKTGVINKLNTIFKVEK